MPRSLAYEIPVDSGFFTPLHLQPAAVCRLAFNGAVRWLERYAISHRRLVAEHRTGFVFWSVKLVPGDPVGFFDADRLDVTVAGRVLGGGTQVACDVEVSGPARRPTRLHAVCVPLWLDGGPALSGAPARLAPKVLSAFRADEIEARPHRSPVPGLLAAIAASGPRVAQGGMPFVIHRHQCEVADQWFWPEAVSLAGAAREELVLAQAAVVPALRLAMQAPMVRLDVLFSRPFYLFDEGTVRSTAYEWEGGMAFVHELAARDEPRPRALAIEQFAWD
ncbi:MAG TPA: acyl-CoA thioesterase [Candidatus Dormibacteraeota bacterium]|nr:acyl-CoA thioesterase [Candidatus Dormibacteraeota bacterium]